MANRRTITYKFAFPDGETKEFTVELDVPTLNFVGPVDPAPPPWTDLRYSQCSNCPLSADQHARCPVAVNVSPVVSAFGDCESYADVDTTVITETRDYHKRCSVQTGLSSLIGLIMVTSGCPVLDKLRPMAHVHLPFSSGTETTFRAISAYALSQCIRQYQGRQADWDFDKLIHAYDEIHIVNKAFAERVRSMCANDAGVNAVVILDSFASLACFALGTQWWKEFEPLFAPCAIVAPQLPVSPIS